MEPLSARCRPGLAHVPATSRLCQSLAACSQEAKHRLGNLMLIGSGLFLLPNMQTAHGVRSVLRSAFPSERPSGFVSLLLPLLHLPNPQLQAGIAAWAGSLLWLRRGGIMGLDRLAQLQLGSSSRAGFSKEGVEHG